MSSLCSNGFRRWFGVPVSNDGLLLPFVFAQRRHFHRGFAGICTRHGPAVVAEIHLGIPFWIARRLCPFCPSVAVAVQRDALDAKSITALFELRGAVARTNAPQIRKQRAGSRQVAQDFLHVFIHAHDGNRAGLPARIADDVVFPINVLGVQAGQIGLRCPQVPGQFIERLAFGILFAGDDGQMFGQYDAALLLEFDGGPLAFRHQRPRQPVHVHAEVVQPPEINIRRDSPHLQNFQKRLGLRFDDDLRQQHGECLVLRGGLPAVLVRPLFGASQRFNGLPPCPRGDAIVAARQIRLGNLEIQHRLALGVVFCFDDLFGIVGVGGAEAGALAGCGVHTIVGSVTNSTADETVTCFHIFHATARITEAESEAVTDSRQIMPDYAGFLRIGNLVSVLVSVADALPLKPLLHSQFGLEARVGIEPTMQLLQSRALPLGYPATGMLKLIFFCARIKLSFARRKLA
jgi:hypothetical protein